MPAPHTGIELRTMQSQMLVWTPTCVGVTVENETTLPPTRVTQKQSEYREQPLTTAFIGTGESPQLAWNDVNAGKA